MGSGRFLRFPAALLLVTSFASGGTARHAAAMREGNVITVRRTEICNAPLTLPILATSSRCRPGLSTSAHSICRARTPMAGSRSKARRRFFAAYPRQVRECSRRMLPEWRKSSRRLGQP